MTLYMYDTFGIPEVSPSPEHLIHQENLTIKLPGCIDDNDQLIHQLI